MIKLHGQGGIACLPLAARSLQLMNSSHNQPTTSRNTPREAESRAHPPRFCSAPTRLEAGSVLMSVTLRTRFGQHTTRGHLHRMAWWAPKRNCNRFESQAGARDNHRGRTVFHPDKNHKPSGCAGNQLAAFLLGPNTYQQLISTSSHTPVPALARENSP